MAGSNGVYDGRITDIKKGGVFEFTTSNHYPGDPNFSGTFAKEFHVQESYQKYAQRAFTDDVHIFVYIKNNEIIKIQRIVDFE